MTDYYNKTWNEPDNHGTTFFKHVDFSAPQYKYQEEVFREYLRTLDKSKIHSVLELGAGTGRMTKIMLDVFPDIERYDAVDIRNNINLTYDNMGHDLFNKVNWHNRDIIELNPTVHVDESRLILYQYDLILASEVFMHIKPEDIEKIIEKVSKMGKQIINIDWSFNPAKIESDWCFMHPYHDLYTKYDARMITMLAIKDINQVLFHYRFRQ